MAMVWVEGPTVQEHVYSAQNPQALGQWGKQCLQQRHRGHSEWAPLARCMGSAHTPRASASPLSLPQPTTHSPLPGLPHILPGSTCLLGQMCILKRTWQDSYQPGGCSAENKAVDWKSIPSALLSLLPECKSSSIYLPSRRKDNSPKKMALVERLREPLFDTFLISQLISQQYLQQNKPPHAQSPVSSYCTGS